MLRELVILQTAACVGCSRRHNFSDACTCVLIQRLRRARVPVCTVTPCSTAHARTEPLHAFSLRRQLRQVADSKGRGMEGCTPAHFLLRGARRLAAGSIVIPQVDRMRDGGHAALKHGRGRLGRAVALLCVGILLPVAVAQRELRQEAVVHRAQLRYVALCSPCSGEHTATNQPCRGATQRSARNPCCNCQQTCCAATAPGDCTPSAVWTPVAAEAADAEVSVSLHSSSNLPRVSLLHA